MTSSNTSQTQSSPPRERRGNVPFFALVALFVASFTAFALFGKIDKVPKGAETTQQQQSAEKKYALCWQKAPGTKGYNAHVRQKCQTAHIVKDTPKTLHFTVTYRHMGKAYSAVYYGEWRGDSYRGEWSQPNPERGGTWWLYRNKKGGDTNDDEPGSFESMQLIEVT